MHFNENPLVIVWLNLKWVWNTMWTLSLGGGGLLALLWFSIWPGHYWTIFLYHAQNKLHFKGSILLLLKSVSVVQANTFCIDLSAPPQHHPPTQLLLPHPLLPPSPKSLLPFLPARLAFKKDMFGRIKILQSDWRTNKPINSGIHILVERKDRGE